MVCLRPQGQGWAVITSSETRSGTSQTAPVSYEVYQSKTCAPPVRKRVLSFARPQPTGVPYPQLPYTSKPLLAL